MTAHVEYAKHTYLEWVLLISFYHFLCYFDIFYETYLVSIFNLRFLDIYNVFFMPELVSLFVCLFVCGWVIQLQ